MKYCADCKALIDEKETKCPVCSKELKKAEAENIVVLTKIKGKNVSTLEPLMKENGIPCFFVSTEGQVYNSYNFKTAAESEQNVMVPVEYYSRAFDICLAMDLVKEEQRLFETEGIDNSESKTYNEKFEEKTGVKHSTWQFVWIILFIVVACLVIWGIDFIAELIKSNAFSSDNAETTAETVKAFIGFSKFW